MIMSILVYRFNLPSYLACGAINDDWSGVDDGDDEGYAAWVRAKCKELCLSGLFCVGVETDSYSEFTINHDYNSCACNTETFIFHGVSMLHPLPLQHHRRFKTLQKRVIFNGKKYTRQELIYNLVLGGWEIQLHNNQLFLTNGDGFFTTRELTRTGMGYASAVFFRDLEKQVAEVQAKQITQEKVSM